MGGYIGARSGTISATVANVQDVTATDTTPEVTIVNNTHEDTDGGREGKVIFKGQQSGGELSTLAEIEVSHQGTADDEKGNIKFKVNDGNDGASPTLSTEITSDGGMHIKPDGLQAPLIVENQASNNQGAYIKIRDGNSTAGQNTWLGRSNHDTYLYANNNDLGIKITGGSSGAGIVTKPNQPAFSAFRDSSTVEGLNGTIVFNGTRSNIGSHYNTSTGKFTAPVAGLYQFNFVGFGSNSTGSVVPSATAPFVTLYNETTSSNLVRSYSYIASSSSHPTLNFSGLVPLAANNVVRIDVGGAYVYSDASDVYLTFSGYLVG